MDGAISLFFNQLNGSFFVLDWLGIFLAKFLPYFIVLAFLYYIWQEKEFSKRFFKLIFVTFSLVLTRGIFTPLIRFFYPKERPFEVFGFQPLIAHSPGSSFPSGHAAFFFALAFAAFLLYRFLSKNRRDLRWAWWFLVLAALNSLGRIYVGIHWFSDILGGVLTAVLSAAVSYLVFYSIIEKFNQKQQLTGKFAPDSTLKKLDN